MKRIILFTIPVFFIMAWAISCHAMNKSQVIVLDDVTGLETRLAKFRQFIPIVAKEFIGIPYQYGGNPLISGSTDNSHLFYAIYAQAAQKAGLTFKRYMPMKILLANVTPISESEIQNGDLIVLKDNHTAMLYQVEKSGKIFCIYASHKRNKVLAFNSENLVFHVYWLENIKGFYRLLDDSLSLDN